MLCKFVLIPYYRHIQTDTFHCDIIGQIMTVSSLLSITGCKKYNRLIFGVLTPLSAIFQLYYGDQF